MVDNNKYNDYIRKLLEQNKGKFHSVKKAYIECFREKNELHIVLDLPEIIRNEVKMQTIDNSLAIVLNEHHILHKFPLEELRVNKIAGRKKNGITHLTVFFE